MPDRCHRLYPLALFALLGASPVLAQAPASAPDPAEPAPWSAAAWTDFRKLPVSLQQPALDAVLAALPTSPWLQAQRQLAARCAEDRPERTPDLGSRRGKRTIEFPREEHPLLQRCDYVFGLGTIVPRLANGSAGKASAGKPAGGKPATGKPAPAKPAGKPAPSKATFDPAPLHHALAGIAPDADHALAVLLHRLDVDPRADAFAAFLQSWRNEDESFYEALDRTAGTPDSVFFFDVMLDDFRGRFGKGQGTAKLGGGLQAAHDALHDSFLAYRQYRGFREAIAWSFVLPPDVPLPARLRRYEEQVSGAYSLRQQVVMVAAELDNDPAALAAAIVESAPKLPEPLWSARYDPYPAWMALFQGKQPAMIERHGSTDACLAAAEAARHAAASALQQLARAQVLQALAVHKAH
jgi:hypothetical protein